MNEVVEVTPVILKPAAPPGLPAEANGSAGEPPGKRQKRAEGGSEETCTEQLPGRMEAPQVKWRQPCRVCGGVIFNRDIGCCQGHRWRRRRCRARGGSYFCCLLREPEQLEVTAGGLS